MYTLTQFAAYLGVDITTVSHWVSRGKIKAITIDGDNKRKFITEEEFERFKNYNPEYKKIGSPSIVIMQLHYKRDKINYELENDELNRHDRYDLEEALRVVKRRLYILNKMIK